MHTTHLNGGNEGRNRIQNVTSFTTYSFNITFVAEKIIPNIRKTKLTRPNSPKAADPGRDQNSDPTSKILTNGHSC